MKYEMMLAHMDVAARYGQLSKAKRLKVGAIIVKGDAVISIGYNGTPPNDDNCCEHELADGSLVTRENVIHAEDNAIGKLINSTETAHGATMVCTHACCLPCAVRVVRAGIASFVYRHAYRDDSGLKYLASHGVDVYHLHTESGNSHAE